MNRLRLGVFFGMMAALMACRKDRTAPQTNFIGSLPFSEVHTPQRVAVGDTIKAPVRCQLDCSAGQVRLYSLAVVSTGAKQFEIRANGLFENWDQSNCLPATLVLDSTVAIPTTSTGTYLLKYYNANQLFKSDSVIVE